LAKILNSGVSRKTQPNKPLLREQPTRRAGFLSQGLASPEYYSRAADWERWAAVKFGCETKDCKE